MSKQLARLIDGANEFWVCGRSRSSDRRDISAVKDWPQDRFSMMINRQPLPTPDGHLAIFHLEGLRQDNDLINFIFGVDLSRYFSSISLSAKFNSRIKFTPTYNLLSFRIGNLRILREFKSIQLICYPSRSLFNFAKTKLL